MLRNENIKLGVNAIDYSIYLIYKNIYPFNSRVVHKERNVIHFTRFNSERHVN